jgi:hypothetical protein
MIEQTTWRTIGSMDRTKETPGFRKKFTHSSCLEFSKECTTMDTTEVRNVSIKVELFSNNGIARKLLQNKKKI